MRSCKQLFEFLLCNAALRFDPSHMYPIRYPIMVNLEFHIGNDRSSDMPMCRGTQIVQFNIHICVCSTPVFLRVLKKSCGLFLPHSFGGLAIKVLYWFFIIPRNRPAANLANTHRGLNGNLAIAPSQFRHSKPSVPTTTSQLSFSNPQFLRKPYRQNLCLLSFQKSFELSPNASNHAQHAPPGCLVVPQSLGGGFR